MGIRQRNIINIRYSFCISHNMYVFYNHTDNQNNNKTYSKVHLIIFLKQNHPGRTIFVFLLFIQLCTI